MPNALNVIDGRGYSISFDHRNWLFYEVFLKGRALDDPITEGVKATAAKQPLYPLLLSFVFLLFGAKHFSAVFVLHAVLAALTAAILFVALRSRSMWQAVSAGCGFALYPAFVVHSVTTPESTTLLLFLLAVLLLLCCRIADTSSAARWTLVGIVSGLLVLAEPVTLPFVVVAVASLGYATRRQPHSGRRLVAAFVLFTAVVSPWLIRNYVVFHRFPVLKSAIGTIFNWGLEESGNGSWIPVERMIALAREGRQ